MFASIYIYTLHVGYIPPTNHLLNADIRTGYGDQFLDHAFAGHVFRPQSVAWMSQ